MGTMTVETIQMRHRTARAGSVQQIISSMFYENVFTLENSAQFSKKLFK
jgi:hypothetical protein